MDALEVLETLSKEEQAKLRQFLNARAATKAVVASGAELDRDDRDLYDALLAACGLRGYHQSVGMFFQEGGESLLHLRQLVLDILEEGRVVDARTRRAVVHTLLACLADTLRDRDVPVLPNALVRSGHMLRYALENAFPGYLDAGMLAQIVSFSLLRGRSRAA